MEDQKKESTDNEEFKDTDQGFNARNQYSGSGDFSPDSEDESGQKEDEDFESSLNSDNEPESSTDLQQDESGTLKSNN
jgi:hypothetical protein